MQSRGDLGCGPYGHPRVAIVVFGVPMRICYLDEAGDVGPIPAHPSPSGNDQPVLVIAGLFVDTDRLARLTHDFLSAKHRFFPGLPYISENYLDRIVTEVKGSDIRRNVTRGTSAQQRHAFGFLDRIIAILRDNQVRIAARIWVKGLGEPFDGKSVYTSSIQALCTYFDHYLSETGEFGIGIADSRTHFLNVNVAHSVFTQKFRANPSAYQRIAETPAFGHSENHAGIQICDLLCSALLYPIACFAYCEGFVRNVHVQPAAVAMRRRYGSILKDLQYRYRDANGRWTGGLVVADAIRQKNALGMFQ